MRLRANEEHAVHGCVRRQRSFVEGVLGHLLKTRTRLQDRADSSLALKIDLAVGEQG